MTDSSLLTAIVLGVDIESWSSRDMEIQLELQSNLLDGFGAACSRIGLDIESRYRQSRGDGSLNLVTQNFDVAVIAADLSRELGIWLTRRNRTRTAEGRLRLRVALHHGQVGVGPVDWTGPTIVETARLLDCNAARQLLASRDDAALVLLLSPGVYAAAVKERRRGLDPEDFVEVEIGSDQAEKGAGIRGYASLYGRGPLAMGAVRNSHGEATPSLSEEAAAPQAPGSPNVGRIEGPTTFGSNSPAIGGNYYGRSYKPFLEERR